MQIRLRVLGYNTIHTTPASEETRNALRMSYLTTVLGNVIRVMDGVITDGVVM
jgi:hypothetical protein